MCQKLEAARVSFVTVHGRTKDQRSEPVNLEVIRNVKDALRIPVVANGDVTSLQEADRVYRATGTNGNDGKASKTSGNSVVRKI